jgi:hypothetical protein
MRSFPTGRRPGRADFTETYASWHGGAQLPSTDSTERGGDMSRWRETVVGFVLMGMHLLYFAAAVSLILVPEHP